MADGVYLSMDRVAFRRLIPVLFVLASGALMLIVRGEQRVRDEDLKAREALLKWEQATGKTPKDAVLWDPTFFTHRLPEMSSASTAVFIIAAPGLPAALVGTGIDAVFHVYIFSYLAWCIGLAGFWYAVGVHLDNLRENDPVPIATFVRYYITTLKLISPIGLVVCSMAYLFDRHGSYVGNNVFGVTALICWCLWGTWSLKRSSKEKHLSIRTEV